MFAELYSIMAGGQSFDLDLRVLFRCFMRWPQSTWKQHLFAVPCLIRTMNLSGNSFTWSKIV